jgi:hypothetical protein
MKNFKNVEFIIYDGLVLFYEYCFSFNIFGTVMEKCFKRVDNSLKQSRLEINLADLPSDPGLRP